MRILHVCLASHYTVGMSYQDNQLADQNAADGHEVVVISDCYRYSGHILEQVDEEDTIISSGVRLVRMKYDLILNNLISNKVRKVAGLRPFLEEYKPDVILFHGAAGYELLTVSRYKVQNPHVKLYVDSHIDFNNSGTFWFSFFFQYRIYNRWLIRKIRKNVDKFLYLSYECRNFLQVVYGLSDNEIEFYPLGGNIVLPDTKALYKSEIRRQLGLSHEDVLILHTGKFVKDKKTHELLEAFSAFSCNQLKLILIGSIPDEMESILQPLIDADERIMFLGWMNSDELVKYLAAADLYIQPGSQSATMQNAICSGTPVALYPYESHIPYVSGNGFFISNVDEYLDLFVGLSCGRYDLLKMSAESYIIAKRLLDYRKLAMRIYQ